MCVHLKIHICVKVVFKYKFYIKPREIIYGLDLPYLRFARIETVFEFLTGVIIIINAIYEYMFEKKSNNLL